MEQYNYYPAQSGHPPPNMTNQHGGPQQLQQQHPPPVGQMIHGPMPPQNIRQPMPPGPPNHHQQLQQIQQQQQQQPPHQQHISHHPQQQMSPHQQQQQPHQNYQIHPHTHGSLSHSGSPHQQQPQHQHHNHQHVLAGPQQQTIPSQHHMHPQSPHHIGGPPQMHMQQPINQMVRPPMGPSIMNHPQPAMQQHPQSNNFFNGGAGGSPIPQANIHHYPQQNQHHPHPPHQHQQQHHHHHHQSPMMHHAPPMSAHQIHVHHQGVGRNSPYHPSILQTEFRIIELNRRLQCRPINRHPVSPLPTNSFDESIWWERFASDFFEDDATLTLRSIQDDKPVEYKIGRTLIPRYFRTYFEGGVTDLSINLRNPREACLQPHLITLDCDQASIVTNNIFKHPALPPTNHGIVVHTDGHLILDFVNNSYDTLSIKSWKFYTKNCREYIDRSMTAMGLPNALLYDPVTRQHGLTKSTISYLKMCMIMEPMQDIMLLHRQTRASPRECLIKILVEKYKYKGDDNKTTSKRRKRKPSAAPNVAGAPNAIISTSNTNKKSKANMNNSLANSGLHNNMMMSPSGQTSFSLASQDVMVVGEPSMMGGDFGDDNERMITRLENTQYDPSASSTLPQAEESDCLAAPSAIDNGPSSNNVELNMDNASLSPTMMQRQQSQQQQSLHQVPIMPHHEQIEQSLSQQEDFDQAQHQQQTQDLQISVLKQEETASIQVDTMNLIEETRDIISQQSVQQAVTNNQVQKSPSEYNPKEEITQDDVKFRIQQQQEDEQLKPNNNQQQRRIDDDADERKNNSVAEPACDSNLMLGINSIEQIENHTNNSIQPMNDESNSNSQLPCSTASATTALEQQQPVDNGVA